MRRAKLLETLALVVLSCSILGGCATSQPEKDSSPTENNERMPATATGHSKGAEDAPQPSLPNLMDASEAELDQILQGDRGELEKLQQLKKAYTEAELAHKEAITKLKAVIDGSKKVRAKKAAGITQELTLAAVDADRQLTTAKDNYEAELVRLDVEMAKAKARNDVERLNSIGQMYLSLKDYTKAYDCFLITAKLGNAVGQSEIGVLYYYGQGVGQDFKEAMTWYRKAVDQGSARAQNGIGGLYLNGKGVKQDLREAMTWYLKGCRTRVC